MIFKRLSERNTERAHELRAYTVYLHQKKGDDEPKLDSTVGRTVGTIADIERWNPDVVRFLLNDCRLGSFPPGVLACNKLQVVTVFVRAFHVSLRP
jgi:hypothetical protein